MGPIIFLLFLAVGNSSFREPRVVANIQAPDKHRVVIGGHLYGLSVKTKKGEDEPLIYREHIMAAYAREVERLNPMASFQLGDLTRYGTNEEWAALNRAWRNNSVPNFWVAGNHDLRNPENFAANGGLRNQAVVIGQNKYLCLDAKGTYSEKDLAWLKDQLVGADQFDHVFVLMHFRLFNHRDPTPADAQLDVMDGYTGVSNWNRDVVPLLLGKVRYVFTGDHYARGANRSLRTYGEHEIFYIHTSFKYRHQGPLIFLELQFDPSWEHFRIIPKIVPFDLHDDWYEDISMDPELVRKALEALKKEAEGANN